MSNSNVIRPEAGRWFDQHQKRFGWAARIGEADFPEVVQREYPKGVENALQITQSRRAFIEIMATKFGKQLVCPGEEVCTGYIDKWHGPQDSWERDGFVPAPCTCLKGRAIHEQQERVKEADRLAQAEEERKRKMKERLESFNLPTRLTAFTLGSYRQTKNGSEEWISQAEKWLVSWPRCEEWLVLWGDFGRGKTGVAVSMACELAYKFAELTIYFVNVADLISEIWGCWNRKDGSDYDLILKLKTVDLLILDDLGAAHKAVDEEAERSPIRHLYEVLDTRYNYGRPVIITTNQTERGLAAIVGPRNMNRIKDSARFLRVTGENLRGGKF